MNIPADLLPGDILGFKGEAIVRWKTDGRAGHVAVYVGNNNVVTALTNTGVGQYPLTIQGTLVWVRRPVGAFNLANAMAWFTKVSGTNYGWDDIEKVADLPIPLPVSQSNDEDMDCSDTCSHFEEAGGTSQFDPKYDKGSITPRDFETTIMSKEIWAAV